MPYTIYKTNGANIATVPDGELYSSNVSIDLIGKNYSGYGNVQNHNFVHLLEHFANSIAPTSPTAGQLWWDTSASLIKIYNGTAWKTLSQINTDTLPPDPEEGTMWFDGINKQLFVYTNSEWQLIGPEYTASQGKSGLLPLTVTDNTLTTHTLLCVMSDSNVYAVFSDDTEFQLASPVLAGFDIIKPGLTLSSTVADITINGFAPLDSPIFTGSPIAPTPAAGDWSTLVATTAFVSDGIATANAFIQNEFLAVNNHIQSLNSTVSTFIGNADSRFTAINVSISANSASLTALNNTVSTFIGNVNSRFAAVNLNISNLSGSLSALNNTIDTFIGNVDSRFSAVNLAISANISRIDSTLDAFISNVSSITNGYAKLVNPLSQTFTGPIIFNNAITYTGSPIAYTDNSTKLAPTSMVQSAIANGNVLKWSGSKKYVSTVAPSSSDGAEGDFWFQINP